MVASGDFVDTIFSKMKKIKLFPPFFNPFFLVQKRLNCHSCAKRIIIKDAEINRWRREMLWMPFLAIGKSLKFSRIFLNPFSAQKVCIVKGVKPESL